MATTPNFERLKEMSINTKYRSPASKFIRIHYDDISKIVESGDTTWTCLGRWISEAIENKTPIRGTVLKDMYVRETRRRAEGRVKKQPKEARDVVQIVKPETDQINRLYEQMKRRDR